MVSDEITLSARFTTNVLDRVAAVARTLTDRSIDSIESLESPCPSLPQDFKCGSAKMVRREYQQGVEPDVVFKVPVSDSFEKEKVCMIGELKFCVTCNIGDAWGDDSVMTVNSVRHVFGECPVRIGVLLTNSCGYRLGGS